MSNVLANLKYAASHEWMLLNADGTVTVGITDHAQEALGDLVFVELPEVGAHFAAEKEIAVVESVKAAADIYMPVEGEVVEVNEELRADPSLAFVNELNQDRAASLREQGFEVTTQDAALARVVRRLRDHAFSDERHFWHKYVGFNYRMTNLQAAVGCGQMDVFAESVAYRGRIAEWYREGLGDLVAFQPTRNDCDRVHWLVSVEVPERDELMAHLDRHGIETRPVFPALTAQTPYRQFTPPITKRIAAHGLSLPTHGKLSQLDVQRVCRVIQSFLA